MEVCEIKIDKGIYNVETVKCDYGLIVKEKCFLIELKGVDVEHACEQLIRVLDDFSLKFKKFNYDYYCRAVVTRMPSKRSAPKLLGVNYRRICKKLSANDSNKKFVCKERQFEEEIS